MPTKPLWRRLPFAGWLEAFDPGTRLLWVPVGFSIVLYGLDLVNPPVPEDMGGFREEFWVYSWENWHHNLPAGFRLPLWLVYQDPLEHLLVSEEWRKRRSL